MNKLLSGFFTLLTAGSLSAQNAYQYQVDLSTVSNDELTVELNVPKIAKKKLEKGTLKFHMPKMVPGTYAVYDFGRFVKDFKAYNRKGKELKVIHDKDANTWVIKKAKKLAKISYKVEDTWDTDKTNVIFEPAGTNLAKSENVYVLNNHGIFGYLKGYEQTPMEIEVKHDPSIYGGTALDRKDEMSGKDVFTAKNYAHLVDNPIMYAAADTVKFKVGNAEILIHTYSPTGRVKSKDLVADIKPILEAQLDYLGGTLPVDKYAFLIFLNEEGKFYLSGAAGALEHSYSSFYTLFEGESKSIAQTVRDVAAHEFFHIVTPLSIHSEEIHYFDFINPQMSEHLWLYEGGTEYAAQHVQVKQGLMPIEQFMNVVSEKMRRAGGAMFKQDLPFTEMSKECLDKYKSQYYNVYQKGALINLCIDLKLRVLTDGAYGIQDMMQDLSKEYGIDKPFKDAELFDDIVRITKQPAMKQFFQDYVAGAKPLPIAELVKAAGIKYLEKGIMQEVSPFGFDVQSAGGVDFDFGRGKLKIIGSKLDRFGKEYIKFEDKDLIHKWNGEELDMNNLNAVLGQHAMSAKAGTSFTVTVLRQVNGEEKEVELKATVEAIDIEVEHAFEINPNPTAEEMKIRKSWLGEYTSKK